MKKVALAYNLNRGQSEHEVEFDSQITIDRLTESIDKKYQCIPVECTENMPEWIRKLIKENFDIIFNVAEGFRGAAREAFYPALFEQLNLQYTGPGPTELLVTHNKGLTKKLLEGHEILLPWSRVLKSENELKVLENENIPFPIIVKLNTEGSSLGMDENCIVSDWEELISQLQKVWSKFKTNVIIEQYIPGRDVSMTYIEGIGSLGPVEYICPDSKIYDFRLKGVDNYTIDVISPKNISQDIHNVLFETTEKIAKLLDVNGYCRIDYRLDPQNKLHFLEVNGQVSFHPIGAFILAGKEHGYEFDDIVHHIINFAMKTRRKISRTGIISL